MEKIRRILKGILIWFVATFALSLIFSSIYPVGAKMPLIFSFFIFIFPIFCAVRLSKPKPAKNRLTKIGAERKQDPAITPIKDSKPSTLHFSENQVYENAGNDQFEIVILRKRQLQSAAKVYQVFLDDKLVATLPNGGAVHFNACPGHHKIAFKGYLRIENFLDVHIGGPSKTIRFYVTISLKTGKIVVEEANNPKYDHIFSSQEPAKQARQSLATPLKKPTQKVSSHSPSLVRIDKMDGHDFEHFTADLLRKLGYERVEVTRGSGDQGVDVIAVKDGKRYAIQCKRYGQKLGNKPVQEVFAGKTIYGCSVAVVLTNNYFTDGAKEAAKATGVELWDRDTLRRMIDYANYKAIV